MKHIAIIFGTRPQVIKLAPLCKELNKVSDQIRYTLINTGQHYSKEMDEDLIRELNLPEIRTLSCPPDNRARLSSMILRITDELLNLSPDLVLVVGDTDSTLAGALSAMKLNIPVGHIEAYCRSFDRSQPEEMNRILVDEIAEHHFAATQNLEYQSSYTYDTGVGIYSERISSVNYSPKTVFGCDILLDTFLMFKDQARVPKELEGVGPTEKFIYLTLHRADVTDEFIREVLKAIDFIGLPAVWPVHPRFDLARIKTLCMANDVIPIKPVSYLESLWLVQNCIGVMSDSGGLVREGTWAEKPVIALRTSCEWSVRKLMDKTGLSILNGWAKLNEFVNKGNSLNSMQYQHGDGKASEKIVKRLAGVLLG